ncbi:Trk system potassium uptake protein [Arenicella chitinivorans]|uniref:Trk system potassium uptake protein n=1 Tax=Arenicella chitinivorans TaxID=1329800 RepID=A0A918S4F4_9GAMM|nr:TrkH family potassium uptake protein [Arenicella chitinivorans]GHA20092.1 Trk system potassium uptake protein [Arenicella chitinivorans]
MHFQTVFKILGVLLIIFSVTQLTPLAVSLIYNDGNSYPFILSFFVTLITGLLLWAPLRNLRRDLRYRDGFLVVVLFWTVLATFGSLPFLTSEHYSLSITDAFFESMSGLTTTGGTILINLDSLPESTLYYRQQLQWLGGMGIVVLAVAIMPMLGIGGMQLYRAETPGPMKDSKLTPRITESAKALWYIYLGLTLMCTTAYWVGGMSLFDAICHAFSTVAIGGFSTHDASIGYFDSAVIESIAVFFMLLASANFSLHFLAWRDRTFKPYRRDSEYRFFLIVILIASLVICGALMMQNIYPDNGTAVRQGLFHLVSILTTTGFTSSGFAWWPGALPIMLILLSFMGGCAGSTAGGIKVMRIQMMYKQGRKEIVRLIHPNAVLSIKSGNQVISDKIINTVTAFFSMYILCFTLTGFALSAVGLDWITAFSAAAACLNNLGPGLGGVALHYADINDAAKWILSFAMLLGRLELFTLLVLFTTTFWRD